MGKFFLVFFMFGLTASFVVADDLSNSQKRNLKQAKFFLDRADKVSYQGQKQQALRSVSRYLKPLLKEIPDNPQVKEIKRRYDEAMAKIELSKAKGYLESAIKSAERVLKRYKGKKIPSWEFSRIKNCLKKIEKQEKILSQMAGNEHDQLLKKARETTRELKKALGMPVESQDKAIESAPKDLAQPDIEKVAKLSIPVENKLKNIERFLDRAQSAVDSNNQSLAKYEMGRAQKEWKTLFTMFRFDKKHEKVTAVGKRIENVLAKVEALLKTTATVTPQEDKKPTDTPSKLNSSVVRKLKSINTALDRAKKFADDRNLSNLKSQLGNADRNLRILFSTYSRIDKKHPQIVAVKKRIADLKAEMEKVEKSVIEADLSEVRKALELARINMKQGNFDNANRAMFTAQRKMQQVMSKHKLSRQDPRLTEIGEFGRKIAQEFRQMSSVAKEKAQLEKDKKCRDDNISESLNHLRRNLDKIDEEIANTKKGFSGNPENTIGNLRWDLKQAERCLLKAEEESARYPKVKETYGENENLQKARKMMETARKKVDKATPGIFALAVIEKSKNPLKEARYLKKIAEQADNPSDRSSRLRRGLEKYDKVLAMLEKHSQHPKISPLIEEISAERDQCARNGLETLCANVLKNIEEGNSALAASGFKGACALCRKHAFTIDIGLFAKRKEMAKFLNEAKMNKTVEQEFKNHGLTISSNVLVEYFSDRKYNWRAFDKDSGKSYFFIISSMPSRENVAGWGHDLKVYTWGNPQYVNVLEEKGAAIVDIACKRFIEKFDCDGLIWSERWNAISTITSELPGTDKSVEKHRRDMVSAVMEGAIKMLGLSRLDGAYKVSRLEIFRGKAIEIAASDAQLLAIVDSYDSKIAQLQEKAKLQAEEEKRKAEELASKKREDFENSLSADQRKIYEKWDKKYPEKQWKTHEGAFWIYTKSESKTLHKVYTYSFDTLKKLVRTDEKIHDLFIAIHYEGRCIGYVRPASTRGDMGQWIYEQKGGGSVGQYASGIRSFYKSQSTLATNHESDMFRLLKEDSFTETGETIRYKMSADDTVQVEYYTGSSTKTYYFKTRPFSQYKKSCELMGWSIRKNRYAHSVAAAGLVLVIARD